MMTDQLSIIFDNWPAIQRGLILTVWIWIASVVLGLMTGFLLAVLRWKGPMAIGWLIASYIEIIRGTPFLVQLFLLYYGGPFVGISLPPITAGIVGLTLYASAYYAEIFRSGLEAVPKGQLEAASMSGLGSLQSMRRVVLPQTMLIILPALTNMSTILLKETAVLSVITVSELTAVLSTIGSVTFSYVPTLGFLALFYWGSLELLTRVGRLLELRSRRYLSTER